IWHRPKSCSAAVELLPVHRSSMLSAVLGVPPRQVRSRARTSRRTLALTWRGWATRAAVGGGRSSGSGRQAKLAACPPSAAPARRKVCSLAASAHRAGPAARMVAFAASAIRATPAWRSAPRSLALGAGAFDLRGFGVDATECRSAGSDAMTDVVEAGGRAAPINEAFMKVTDTLNSCSEDRPCHACGRRRRFARQLARETRYARR